MTSESAATSAAVRHRLGERGPSPLKPVPAVGPYRLVQVAGDLAFVAGHTAVAGGPPVSSRFGEDIDVDDARRSARDATLACLASPEAGFGDLGRIRQFVKVLGMVRATPDVGAHTSVINGCPDLIVDLFGSRGEQARSAGGMASLPFGAPVEIEMLVRLEPAAPTREPT